MFKKTSLRMFLTLLLILTQMTAAVALSVFVVVVLPWVLYVGWGLSFLVFLYIVRTTEAGEYKLAWIIIVLLVPGVGGLMYMLFGKQHYMRRRLTTHAREHAVVARLLDKDPAVDAATPGGLLHYVRRASSYHAYTGTGGKYYAWGQDMFADMLEAIDAAEKYIFLEFFIVKQSKMWDTLLAKLAQKAARGVEVRVIVDDFGSQKLFTNKYMAYVRRLGIKVLRFNPIIPFIVAFMNNRDHRKMLVIDGTVAFTGGINISDEYVNDGSPFGLWKDTGLRIAGDAVWSFTLMFIEMWDTFSRRDEHIADHEAYRATFDAPAPGDAGLVLPYGCSPLNNDRLGENIYIDILNRSEKYVYIFTPYLIISEKMTQALTYAAKRGVDVCIAMPGIPDKKMINRLSRSYYRPLIKAGVKIYEYTPGFMHAKSFVCDDALAVVGTINLDFRSLYLHFECAVLLLNTPTVMDIKKDALAVFNVSRRVEVADTRRRFIGEIGDAILHIFAPLL